MLEHGGRPREHPVGRLDESPPVCKPGLGGDETAAWIQAGVSADALVSQDARQVEPLDRRGLAGAVLPETENPSHEPEEDAIDVGDTEPGRESWNWASGKTGAGNGSRISYIEKNTVSGGPLCNASALV